MSNIAKMSSFVSGIIALVLLLVFSFMADTNNVGPHSGWFDGIFILIRRGNVWAILAFACFVYVAGIVLYQAWLWIKAKTQGNSNY